MNLDGNEIYDLSNLTIGEKNILREYLYKIENEDNSWSDDRYINASSVLFKEGTSWLINLKGDKIPTKDAKELFNTQVSELLWENRESLRGRWFKRKNYYEESLVRHLQNKKNLVSGEFELYINGISAEQFKKEFEWI